MSEPMSAERLAGIRERVGAANTAHGAEAIGMNATIMWSDVPALLAGVERLREELKVSRGATEQTALDLIEQRAENARLRAELEAAKLDLHDLSDVYKFCDMCKYHTGDGVYTCKHSERFSCESENFYEWRGVPANTPAQGATDENGGKENG